MVFLFVGGWKDVKGVYTEAREHMIQNCDCDLLNGLARLAGFSTERKFGATEAFARSEGLSNGIHK